MSAAPNVHLPEGFVLTPEDESMHTPDDLVNFNESVYCSGWDPKLKAGVWMRLGNRVNEGHAELSLVAYLPDGRLACQFKRPKISHNDAFDAGGLRYRCLEPFQRIEMVYEGELLVLEDPELLRDAKALFASAPRVQGSMRLEATAVSPAHGGEPTSREYADHMLYGYDFSRGHFNQHVRSVGEMVVGDERIPIDGFGWRDHSWGPRFWQEIWFYRLFMVNFGADRGLMLLRNNLESGRTKRLGVVLVDGEYEEVTDLDVTTEWSDDQEPVSVTVGFSTARRRELVHGRVLRMAPLRNRRKAGDETLVSRVAEGFSEWTWGDRVGYGMIEYIERVQDGVPVGYPT
ncbi:hypothetical protein FSW04_05230 [Baekduia soli]|uniref:DUF7064 domain-containing protein n=1 Tax=Baekduia soli TaxID=496014 RepID=A0A5B8U206_9ACTN|nr:hypothetical protein [Baekduia soli]QEC47046.1 hypothetical protein FSW04_05230 [Baekduia soli]